MSAPKPVQTPDGGRRGLILSKLSEVFGRLFGKGGGEIESDVPLLELGVDSLFLLQASQVIRDEFGVKIPFRLLLEEVSTVEAIAEHLDARLPADFGQSARPANETTAATTPQATPPPAATHISPAANDTQPGAPPPAAEHAARLDARAGHAPPGAQPPAAAAAAPPTHAETAPPPSITAAPPPAAPFSSAPPLPTSGAAAPSPTPCAEPAAPATAAPPVAYETVSVLAPPAFAHAHAFADDAADGADGATAVQHIIAQQLRIGEEQLRLMSLQLELLRGADYQTPAPAAAHEYTHADAGVHADANLSGGPGPLSLPPPHAPSPDGGPATAAPPPAAADASAHPKASAPAPSPAPASSPTPSSNASPARKIEPETFVPYKPISKSAGGALSEVQRRHLDALVARLCERTAGSKRLTARYRPRLANKRATAGYRQLWKELVYPLVIERGEGARVWDVDGNEYVDLTSGFGALLFGHTPDFITRALREQLDKGLQIGGHTALAGEVAELICELTGAERVSFCNSGTEAVMGALRLARAVTGRSKIALFEGCYHGTFDGIMVRGEAAPEGGLRALPMAPGVPQKMIDDVLLLKYNSPESLDILRRHARELAAVLIEPPRSRRPDVQPQEFLRGLRAITEEAGAALIFDEVVTGFRFHPGGAQAMFGIQADLVTYGKAVGGGVPVAVIAGKAAYMDAVDGGAWNYGDASFPEADITFMTGTYFQHPVIMAALRAALTHIKEQGTRLQERLAEMTARIAGALNAYFDERRVPLRVAFMGSLFRLLHPPEARDVDLFYYHLLEKGVFVCETRNCLLSTAHTDEDVEHVIRAFRETTDEMVAGGFLPVLPPDPPGGGDRVNAPAATTPPPHPVATAPLQPHASAAGNAAAPSAHSVAAGTSAAAAGAPASASSLSSWASPAVRVPLTEGQRQIWALAAIDEEGARAYNQSVALELRGALRPEALAASLQKVVARHEALRATFSPDGDHQEIAPALDIPVPVTDLSGLRGGEREAEAARLLEAVGHEAFDLARGPLLRARLLRLSAEHHVLALTMHHIVSDGWSMGIILRELEEFYAEARAGRAPRLRPPDSFVEYALAEAGRRAGPEAEAGERYWLGHFAPPLPPPLELPTDRPRADVQTYAGAQQRVALDEALYPELKRLSAARGCTLFMTLLAGFKVLLHHLTGQQDIVVGTPAAGQLAAETFNLVGYCVNLLPLRSRVSGRQTFADYLGSLKTILAGAYEHQDYPYASLLRRLNLPRVPGRSPLVEAIFNLDHGLPPRQFFDLELELRPNHNRSSKFDLTLDVTEADGRLTLDCEYNTGLFSPERARQWMAHYEAVLRAAAADPSARIDDIREALRDDERLRQAARGRQLRQAQLKRFQTARRKAVRAS